MGLVYEERRKVAWNGVAVVNATDARYESEHGDAQSRAEAMKWQAEHTEAGMAGRIDGAPCKEAVEANVKGERH